MKNGAKLSNGAKLKLIRAAHIRKMPIHVRTSLDRLEYIKDVLERQVERCEATEASKRVCKAAHAEFYKAYVRFANLAARYCEQGLL